MSVTWCDDIRHEVGNKPSLMGVYTSGLAFQNLPATVARLGLMVTVYTPAHQPFESLKVRVMRSDSKDPVGVMEIPPEHLAQIVPFDPKLEDDEPRAVGFTFAVMLGPLEIGAECKWLKVWVDTESDPIESFKLPILLQPPVSASAAAVRAA